MPPAVSWVSLPRGKSFICVPSTISLLHIHPIINTVDLRAVVNHSPVSWKTHRVEKSWWFSGSPTKVDKFKKKFHLEEKLSHRMSGCSTSKREILPVTLSRGETAIFTKNGAALMYFAPRSSSAWSTRKGKAWLTICQRIKMSKREPTSRAEIKEGATWENLGRYHGSRPLAPNIQRSSDRDWKSAPRSLWLSTNSESEAIIKSKELLQVDPIIWYRLPDTW